MIGETFPTTRGGILTVVKVEGSTCYVKCSICSEDKELFPIPFKISKLYLTKKGGQPCVCSTKGGYKWSKEQQILRCRRACVLTGDEFLGFTKDTFDINSRATVRCCKGHITDTRLIGDLINNRRGCKQCKGSKISETLSHDWVGKTRVVGEAIHRIISHKDNKIFYNCSVCNKDTDLFPDIFKLYKSDWGRKLSCGCSKQVRWSEPQFRLLCIRKCDTLANTSFEGFSGEYKGSYTKVIQRCLINKDHGCWKSSTIDKLLYGERGCPKCAESSSSFGVYHHREQEVDTLYLLRFHNESEDFIKIGRTFKLEDRLKTFRNKYDVDVIATVKDTHLKVHTLERKLLRQCKNHHYEPHISFGGSVKECFTSNILKYTSILETFNL